MGESPAAVTLTRIAQIAVPVANLDRAVAFYRDTLGLPLLFQAPPNLAFFACGEVRLMLDGSSEARNPIRSPLIYYLVPDLDAAFDAIVGRDAPVVATPHLIAKMPDHQLWMAFIKDSEDNMIALMSEVR
jgi:methylmalonyl-CoA/ethylmalonyl-CoA epimerase